MLREYLQRYQTPLFILILIVITCIGWVVFINIQNSNSRVVSLSVIPSNATVELNGVTTTLRSTTTLPFGTHTLSVSKEGFSSKTVEIAVTKDGDYENYEPIALSPVTDEAIKWVEENNELYGDFFDSKNLIDPVFSYLPSSNLIYTVDSTSTSTPITLTVSSLGNYKNAPIEYLKRSGVDPSNYLYVFNYKNPFKVSTNE